MDISSQDATQSISDDQDLAKALAGVMPDEPEESSAFGPALPGQVSPLPGVSDIPSSPLAPPSPLPAPTPGLAPAPVAPPAPVPLSTASPSPIPVSNELDVIKKDALSELRPLVDKVSLPPQERFDIYLMLLRSTDDSSLIPPAHSAAHAITDEKKRAEALLEIIKEIDYLSRKDQ